MGRVWIEGRVDDKRADYSVRKTRSQKSGKVVTHSLYFFNGLSTPVVA
jgi:hypothetical protein